MELKDIVSVTGVAGLHKIIGQNKTGLVLESLADGKKFASNIRQRVSILADIAIYTEEGEAKLAQVFQSIESLEASGKTAPDHKASNDDCRAYMAMALPDYDRERVYPSDMKKLFVWYHLLKGKMDFAASTENPEGSEEDAATTVAKKAKQNVGKTANTAKKSSAKTSSKAAGKSQTNVPRKMS
jgi:hypothetical protein